MCKSRRAERSDSYEQNPRNRTQTPKFPALNLAKQGSKSHKRCPEAKDNKANLQKGHKPVVTSRQYRWKLNNTSLSTTTFNWPKKRSFLNYKLNYSQPIGIISSSLRIICVLRKHLRVIEIWLFRRLICMIGFKITSLITANNWIMNRIGKYLKVSSKINNAD